MGKLFTQYWFTKNTPAHIDVSVYILLSFDKQIISTRQPSVHLFIYHAEIKKMKIIFLQKMRLPLLKSMSDLITAPGYLLGVNDEFLDLGCTLKYTLGGSQSAEGYICTYWTLTLIRWK